MSDISKQRPLLSTMLSAGYGTLLSVVSVFILLDWMSNWNHLATARKFWIVFASMYAVILPVSGLLYAIKGWRMVGFVHAVLMLGIAGIVFCAIIGGIVTGPGSDNAAGGIIAAANLVFVISGILAAVCGVAVALDLLSKKENWTDGQ